MNMGSIPARAVIRSKNHVNKRKQTMEEIIDMLALGEAFLVCLGMAYLEAIADARQFRGFLLQCVSEFRRQIQIAVAFLLDKKSSRFIVT